MCEHFEQYRASFLACGAVHLVYNSQPQPKVTLRPTRDMVRITRGQHEARIHDRRKKIITGDRVISHHSCQHKIGAQYGRVTDGVAICSTAR